MTYRAVQTSCRLSAILALSIFSGPSLAEDLSALRGGFVDDCVTTGNTTEDCACMFDGWIETVPAEQQSSAGAALDLFLGRPPANPNDMLTAAMLLPTMMSVLSECASGVPVPNTTQQSTPQPTVEAENTAAEDDAKRAEARAEAKGLYEAELTRIHAAPIMDRATEEYETLFTLYCQSSGTAAAECSCGWEALASTNPSPATAYLASRSEGDDVFSRLTRDEFYAGLDGLDAFYTARSACD